MILLKKNNKNIILYAVVIGALLFGVFYMYQYMTSQTAKVQYSAVVDKFKNNTITEFELDLGTGDLKYFEKNVAGEQKYKVPNVSLFVDIIEKYVVPYNENPAKTHIKYNYIPAKDNSMWVSLLPILLLAGMMIFFYFLFMRQASGGKMSQFGKTNMKNPVQQGKKTTFAEVAGADEEKQELAEIVDFLKSPSKFNELGARIPKGVLLMGPPGTGKTLLARAVAGEAGVPFFSISGSDFVEMYVGVGASRVRDLFSQAKKNAPSIIFIDEIDAVGRHRGAGLGGGHDEREQTLNQLLVEMDGFGDNEGVVVIAATNRRDILDPALLRPGRFDREVAVGYPDVKGREEILKVHSKNKPLGFDVDLKVIARSTAGFTGADLENLLNEAALLAARRGRKAIIEKDIEEATIKVIAGTEKKSRVITEREKKAVAYHEAGHAICMHFLETQDQVHHITIIPRGMAAGMTISLPDKDKTLITRSEMRESIIGLLGGRVAEELTQGDIGTGASNDLERATSTARAMVTKYGFTAELGPVVYGKTEHEVFLGREFNQEQQYSDQTAQKIDSQIKSIIETAYEECTNMLKEHMSELTVVAEYLIKHEKVDSTEFNKLIGGELTLEDVKADEKAENTQSSGETTESKAKEPDEGEVQH